MAENKLAKIEGISFIAIDETAYARALDGCDPAGNDTAAFLPAILAAFGLGGLGLGLPILFISSGIIATPVTIVAAAIGGILGGWSAWSLGQLAYRKARKRTLADPLCRFEWRLAKAVEIFNERVYAFNHLLSGHELCLAPGDEKELARIHGLLSQSRKVLARGKETRDWLQNNNRISALSLEPKLAPLLAELAEAECDLQEHLAELKGDASPARQLLENEAELIELTHEEVRALLTEKT